MSELEVCETCGRKFKADWINISVAVGLLITLVFGILLFINLRSQEAQCVANPIQYGGETIAKQEGVDVTITLSAYGKNPLIYQTELYPKPFKINP